MSQDQKKYPYTKQLVRIAKREGRMYAMNQKAKTPESHKSDIHNANKGSSGTNKAWDKKHGNRGKQMNSNQANQAKS